MNVLLDTSVIISFFVEDAHTARAETIMRQVFEGKVKAFAPSLVLAETCGAICRKAGVKNAEAVLAKLSEWVLKGLLVVMPEPEEFYSNACRLAVKHSLKGADAVIAALAESGNLKLVTFDDELISKLKLEEP